MLSATDSTRPVIEPISQPTPTLSPYLSTQPAGPTYSAPTGTTSSATDTSGGGLGLYRLSAYQGANDANPWIPLNTSILPGGTPVTQQPNVGTPLPGIPTVDFSSITDPYGGNVSAPTAGDTAQTSMLASVLASLGGLLGSSASGGSGAASPGAVTAVPVSASSSTGNPAMKNLLILAVVVGVAYYGYKKGWFRKLGIGGSAAA